MSDPEHLSSQLISFLPYATDAQLDQIVSMVEVEIDLRCARAARGGEPRRWVLREALRPIHSQDCSPA